MTNTKHVPTPKLEDYKKTYSEHMSFERKNGILQVRLHTKGGPVKWSFEMHQAMAEAWTTIGHDPENEVIILTSTDPYWIGEFDMESFATTPAGSWIIGSMILKCPPSAPSTAPVCTGSTPS